MAEDNLEAQSPESEEQSQIEGMSDLADTFQRIFEEIGLSDDEPDASDESSESEASAESEQVSEPEVSEEPESSDEPVELIGERADSSAGEIFERVHGRPPREGEAASLEEDEEEDDLDEIFLDERAARRIRELEKKVRDLSSWIASQAEAEMLERVADMQRRVRSGRQLFSESHPELTAAEVVEIAKHAWDKGFLQIRLEQGEDPEKAAREALELAYRSHPKLERKWLDSRLEQLKRIESESSERKRKAAALSTGGRVPASPPAKLPSGASEVDFEEFLKQQFQRVEPPLSG